MIYDGVRLASLSSLMNCVLTRIMIWNLKKKSIAPAIFRDFKLCLIRVDHKTMEARKLKCHYPTYCQK